MLEQDERQNPFFADRVTTLKLERERKGITTAALARVAWVNAAELSKIERGRVIPYEGQAKRIAAAIGWGGPLEELFSTSERREASGCE